MDGISLDAAINSPFSLLQAFLVNSGATATATDQDKANWIKAYVDQIPQSVFFGLYAGRGSKPHPPVLMFKLALYQIVKQHLSPSKWAREVDSDTVLQKLIGHITPSRTALYNFRDRIINITDGLLDQLITRAVGAGLLEPSHAALDGTSVRSRGSRHRVVNQITLKRRRIALAEAIATDTRGEVQLTLPKWMGKTVIGRLLQQGKYDKADAILTSRIQENSTKRKDLRRDVKKIYISLSDAESALSRDKEWVFCPMYNVQLLTDTKSLLILGFDVSNQVTDVGTIGPMIDRVKRIPGVVLERIYADSAYTSQLDLEACRERGVEILAPVHENSFTKDNQAKKTDQQIPRDKFTYNADSHSFTCPAGHSMPYSDREVLKRVNGEVVRERFRQSLENCQACPLAAQCLRGGKQRSISRMIGQEIVEEQKAKMTDDVARECRAIRAQTIEYTNANIKQRIGLRRFGVETIRRARSYLALTLFVLNLMTIRRLLIQDASQTLATT